MTNTKAQRRKIERELFSQFTHPSPALKKKWEKRRAEKGNGQDVLDREFEEWINEGNELPKFYDRYANQLTATLWNNKSFREDVETARKTYLENDTLPPLQQDYECLARLNQELGNKYDLNFGWLSWLAHCIQTGENDPGRIIFYLPRIKGTKAGYLSLDIYFPLPKPVYDRITIDLRMKEPEVFGDYYSQEQGGGRSEHSRPQEVIRRYKRIISLRNSSRWRMRTDKEFLDHYKEYNRSELARARKWEREQANIKIKGKY